MGLDMYLNRMPRYRKATADDVRAVEGFLDWIIAKANGSEYANCTLDEWCGVKKIPKNSYVNFYTPFYRKQYSHWDTEHQFGYARIMEQVGYWRKANAIHNWFVENVQDGEDDCGYHHEVTKEILEKLLDVCQKVLNSCELIPSKVENGYTYSNGNKVINYIDGYVVKDPAVAMELLTSQSGFFFGGTDYDEWYVNNIKDTIDIITKVLETTDFDKEMIYYVSSW